MSYRARDLRWIIAPYHRASKTKGKQTPAQRRSLEGASRPEVGGNRQTQRGPQHQQRLQQARLQCGASQRLQQLQRHAARWRSHRLQGGGTAAPACEVAPAPRRGGCRVSRLLTILRPLSFSRCLREAKGAAAGTRGREETDENFTIFELTHSCRHELATNQLGLGSPESEKSAQGFRRFGSSGETALLYLQRIIGNAWKRHMSLNMRSM